MKLIEYFNKDLPPESAPNKSFVSNRNRDCLGCRFVSGFGLIGIGLYLAQQSQKFKHQKAGRYVMLTCATGSGLLGAARLFDLPPFRDAFNHKSETRMTE